MQRDNLGSSGVHVNQQSRTARLLKVTIKDCAGHLRGSHSGVRSLMSLKSPGGERVDLRFVEDTPLSKKQNEGGGKP